MGTASSEERTAHPIDAIGVIKNQINALHELHGELESRLSPVINKPRLTEEAKAPEGHDPVARSPVMQGLELIQFNLAGLSDKIKGLIRVLDL